MFFHSLFNLLRAPSCYKHQVLWPEWAFYVVNGQFNCHQPTQHHLQMLFLTFPIRTRMLPESTDNVYPVSLPVYLLIILDTNIRQKKPIIIFSRYVRDENLDIVKFLKMFNIHTHVAGSFSRLSFITSAVPQISYLNEFQKTASSLLLVHASH